MYVYYILFPAIYRFGVFMINTCPKWIGMIVHINIANHSLPPSPKIVCDDG